MTYLVERLAELRRHVTHLQNLRPRASERAVLERDLSLHNDVMFSLLMIAQLVIDVAGELSARRGDRFDDYTEAAAAAIGWAGVRIGSDSCGGQSHRATRRILFQGHGRATCCSRSIQPREPQGAAARGATVRAASPRRYRGNL